MNSKTYDNTNSGVLWSIPKSYEANRYTEKEKFKPSDRVFGY